MPGGLQGVEQTFTADASGYLAAIRQMVEGNQGLAASVRDTVSQIAEAQKAFKGLGAGGGAGDAADGIAKTNAAIRGQLAALREVQPAIAAAKAVTGDYASAVQYLGSTHADLAPQIRLTTAAIGDHAVSVQGLTRVAAAATSAVADHAVVLQRAADAHGSGTESVMSYVTGLGLL